MSELKQIRKRIASRRRQPSRRRVVSHKSPLFAIVYGLAMLAMGGACLGLGWMINEKTQWLPAQQTRQLVEQVVQKLNLDSIAAWIPFENWFARSEPVASTVFYQPLEGQFYQPSNGNQVQCLMDGVVLYIGSQDSGKLVMVKQDNGVLATYGALQDVQVKLNDRLLRGSVLGSVEQAVFLDFSRQGQSVSLQQAMEDAN